jgi:ribosome-associated translation inhibitor RaiA
MNNSENNNSTINLTYKNSNNKQADILLIDIEKNFCVHFHIKIKNHKIKTNQSNTIYTLIDKARKWIKIAIQLLVVLYK